MPISDNDLQVLEEWLDGELPDEQTESLRRRMSMEPDLSAAADRLRGDRQLRSRMFSLLEPTDGEMDSLVTVVRREVRKEDLWASRARAVKKLTAVAASIVLVFMAGWISRERLQVGPQGSKIAAQPLPIQGDNNVILASSPLGLQDPGRLPFTNPPRGVDLTRLPVASPADERRQGYQLILRDPSGKLFVLQDIDPAAFKQRTPIVTIPQPPQRQLGQGTLVSEERPQAR